MRITFVTSTRSPAAWFYRFIAASVRTRADAFFFCLPSFAEFLVHPIRPEGISNKDHSPTQSGSDIELNHCYVISLSHSSCWQHLKSRLRWDKETEVSCFVNGSTTIYV